MTHDFILTLTELAGLLWSERGVAIATLLAALSALTALILRR